MMTLPRSERKSLTLSSRYSALRIAAAVVLALTGLTLITNSAFSYAGQPTFTQIDSKTEPTNDDINSISSPQPSSVILPTLTVKSDTAKDVQPSLPVDTNIQHLGYSKPTFISIQALKIRSEIIEVDKSKDGELEVPLGENVTKAGWYKYSPSPGQAGTSVIAGHVDKPDGSPNIFFQLGELKLGDIIDVSRQDGSIVQFEVTATNQYPKDIFPTEQVYGWSTGPTLNIITCGGQFDEADQDYDSNIVVSASIKQKA